MSRGWPECNVGPALPRSEPRAAIITRWLRHCWWCTGTVQVLRPLPAAAANGVIRHWRNLLVEPDRFRRERDALLRIAALALDSNGQRDMFDAVTAEAAAWSEAEGAALIRFNGAGEYTVVGSCAGSLPVGTRIAMGEGTAGTIAQILRSAQARPQWRDSGRIESELPEVYVADGSIGTPVFVDDRLWGALVLTTGGSRLSPTAVQRLQQFATVVTASVAHSNAQEERQVLVAERASLRRIHAVAGRGGTGADVLAAIAAEGSAWLDGLSTRLVRLDDDGTSTVVASSDPAGQVTDDQSQDGAALIDEVIGSATASHVDGAAQPPVDEREARPAVGVPLTMAGRTWGVFVAISPARTIPPDIEHRLTRFAEAITPTIQSAQARTQLAQEQSALRRVAEVAARDAPTEEILAAVALEASTVANVEYSGLFRHNPDGSTEIVALHGAPEGYFVGMRAPGDGDGKVLQALKSGQHARVDDLTSVPGSWPAIATRSGFTTGVGVPISINGALWGALFAAGRQTLSAATEEQLTRFADLAGVAMSAAQARRAVRTLAETEAALSRVAGLVARGAALDEVFTAVATEASHLIADVAAVLVQFDSDGSFIAVAAANSAVPVGFRGLPQEVALLTDLTRTGIPAPLESFQGTLSTDAAQQAQIGPTIAAPITVEGRLWGALTLSSRHWPVPEDIDQRLRKFAELAGAAIANAENKANLTASRARVVAAADEARRRLQRDVHDTAQQRLVHTILTLKLAQQAITTGGPPDALVEEALLNAERASSELRDIVRGILPAALTRGGLRLGLESLISDLALTVDLSVTSPRVSTATEQTAYLIVAEALTNVIKHAHAERAAVSVALEGDTLVIEVRDDGIGGADPIRGTGLVGLADRVDAVDGALTLASPPGGGTTLLVSLPVLTTSPQ